MDYQTISILKSLVFIGMFVIATYLCVPKSMHFWELWKTTKKNIHLSNAVGNAVAAFLLYSADFVMMVMKILGLA